MLWWQSGPIDHDAQLRDDAPGRRDRSLNQPETHAVLERWRAIADGYEPPRVLLGERLALMLLFTLRGTPVLYYGDELGAEVSDDATLVVEDLRSGRRYEGLHVFEDVAEIGDAYNHCPLPGRPWTSAGAAGRVWVRERGPVRGELEVALTLRLPARLSADRRRRVGSVACRVRTIVRLDAGADRVELDTTVDNRARDHRLRVLFCAPDANPASVRAEGHFGVVTRRARVHEETSRWKEPPQPGQHFHGGALPV